MKKYLAILTTLLFTACTGAENNNMPITEKPKPKKIYRLVGVKKDSTRVILGTFNK